MNKYQKETEFLGLVMTYLRDIKLTGRGGEIGYREAWMVRSTVLPKHSM